jgi:hypothetical protein
MKTQSTVHGQVIKNGKLVYSEIIINATPDKVWEVFTDFAAYPGWNPFVKSFKGQPQQGGNIEVLLQLPGSKPMTFKPTVLQYEKNKELRWIGKLFIPYLFDGEHTFTLTDNGDGTTTFQQYENFRGILIPFMKQMLDVNTLNGFRLMNEALKARVEAMK